MFFHFLLASITLLISFAPPKEPGRRKNRDYKYIPTTVSSQTLWDVADYVG